jgi:ATP-dependent exoDNAse (exonuclease V) alpha subunit
MEDTDRNVFITGKAGTGKSTLLQYFRDSTKKKIAVLAPTGVAAVNVKGQTIHSFFSFRPDITPDSVSKIRPRKKEIYKKLDAIVIDEISMVRADLLDCVDRFLRKHGRKKTSPFGGVQMIFIGDLYQLPPVVTSRERTLFQEHYKSPYFFSARVFDEDLFSKTPGGKASFEMEFIELEKVYRQEDERFLNILNRIRNNTVTDDDMEEINKRCDPAFEESPDDLYIYLTTTNTLAEKINIKKLSELKVQEHSYQGIIDGDFQERNLPTLLNLTLKQGAQVMLLNNDTLGRWINGSIGRIRSIDPDEDGPDVLWVELADGEVVDVTPYEWEMYEFSYDRETAKVISESVGSFTQYPLRLAWAVTIHKAQGMTFEKAVIDIGQGTFSHGQLYVALSRCTTISGIVLKRPIHRKNVLLDRRVVGFVTQHQYKLSDRRLSLKEKFSLLNQAIKGKNRLEIIYLKTNDKKTKRTIIPAFAGELRYQGRKFPGLQAFCTERRADRVFHLERILDMKIVKE